MGSSKKVTVGYWYGMGLHFGLCHGPVDELQQIKVGDRDAWCGSVTDNATVNIDAEELFGGKKKEGGVVGSLDVLMGGASQTANSYLTSKIGTPMPAFKGILSAVMNASKIAANNPYIKPWAFRVKRTLQGWSTGAAWYPLRVNILPEGFAPPPDEDYWTQVDESTWVYPSNGTFLYTVTDNVSGWTPTRGTISARGAFGSYVGNNTYVAPSCNRAIHVEKNVFLPGGNHKITIETFNDDGCAIFYKTPNSGSFEQVPHENMSVPDYFSRVFELEINDVAGEYIFILQVTDCRNDNFESAGSQTNIGAALSISVQTLSNSVPCPCRQMDMNPAHILYQCLTDTVWGMGYPTSSIDDTGFTAAADTLYFEKFGLSLLWNQQESIESFIRIVLDHIGGILYVDPGTGKFKLKLIRDDYDRNTLPIFGPSNLISASDYQRQAWGETVNEITVVYTDPCVNKGASVTVQDLANIQTQGAVIAQTRQYPGITNPTLAQRVAMRDLLAFSTPLAKIKLSATRAAWDLIPGDVFRLNWPEYGIDDVVYRVLEVNRGTLQNGEIAIEAVEDVFGMPDSTYVSTQESGWTNPSSAPAPAPYRKLVEAPYWDIARSLSAADLAMLDPLSGYLATLAVRPSSDSISYEINSKVGSAEYEPRATGQFCPAAALTVALTKTSTAMAVNDVADIYLVETGGYAIIDDEYIGITTIDAAAGTATITRGLLDTVPAEHSVGAPIWFADGYQGVDATEYADGEQVDVKLLPSTGQGELDISLAPTDSLTMDQRQYRPYPPGKVLVNGSAYPDWISGSAELALSWAHRDRLSQTAYLVTQNEASIGPEVGTTYTIRIYGEQDTLIRTYSGETGTSKTYPAATELADSLIGSGAPLTDQYWHNVSSLLHFNGANNSTTFTDEKGHTWSRTGSAVISTAQNVYGGASLRIPNTSSYLTRTGESLGSGNFTLEFRARADVIANSFVIFDCRNADIDANGFAIYMRSNGKLTIGGGSPFVATEGATTLVANTWYKVRLIRESGVMKAYLNDNDVAEVTRTFNVDFSRKSWRVGLGISGSGGAGYIDEMRITLGVARSEDNTDAEFPNTGDYRLNGRLRVELESVRYLGNTRTSYAVPQISGWNGTDWIGELGVENTYLYKASPDLSAYTSLNLNLPYAKVAFGNGIYLAISANGPCKTSTDGVTWTDQTGAPTGVQKLVYMGSQFVALGLYTIHTSTNGVTWTLKATLSYRPLDIAYSGSLWMVVGNHKSATQVFAATSSDLITWTDVSPTLTNWNGSNLLADVTAQGGTLQADFACVIYSGSAFYIGGRFVVDIENQYRFHPLVYKYQSGVFTDCCPPLFGPVVVGSGYSVTSLAVVDTKIVAAGFRLAAYATLSTLTYSSWSMCTMPSTPAGVLDTSVAIAGNGTDAVLTTHMGGSNLITADGITFTATTGSIENNPVAVAPSGGVTSWQRHNHTVRRTGYGFNYGMYYG